MTLKENLQTQGLCNVISRAMGLINEAEKIVIGIGSGLSAAGGLNYHDTALMKKWCRFDQAHLLRINNAHAEVPKEIVEKALSIEDDLGRILNEMSIRNR